MYKVKHKLCPSYISNIFNEHNSKYNLRQSDFSIPRFNNVTHGKHSIRYLGPKLWANLPKRIQEASSLKLFKYRIRQFNITQAVDDGCRGCSLCSSQTTIQCVVWDLRGTGDCGSLRLSSINWVYRIRLTTIFTLYNINYIDFLYTTYILRIR